MEIKTKIAYQNKDIMSKVLAEEFKGKSFDAYGVNLPRIIDSRPTELAIVEANELRMDRLFLLEDNSYLLVDYESDYSEAKKFKYMGYIARLMKTLYNELKYYPQIRVLIIYTADVVKNQTNPDLFLGAVQIHIEEAFLSEIDGTAVFNRITQKIRDKEPLDGKDLMQLIVYPLTYRTKAEKQNAIHETIGILDKFDNERQRLFTLKGLLVFCDKVIMKEDAEKIRRMLMLTKVEQIIEQEKQEAVAKATAAATAATTISVTDRIATNFLRSGCSPEYVAENTQLSLEAVLELKKKL